MSELWNLLSGVNLIAAAAIALVLILRLPVRRGFGVQAAYALWLVVPLAFMALIVPARVVTAPAPVLEPTPFEAGPVFVSDITGTTAVGPAPKVEGFALVLWGLGAAVSVAVLVRRQRRFTQAAREGLAGPAVVGVFRPRIVAPTDFAERYTAPEQAVVMAHERTHIDRHDSRINAVVAALRCLCWFNPLVHLGAHVLRIDQELSCDARVVAAHPKSRRAYAEAMLKTQLAARPLPLGCYWPAQSKHPLAERIRLLAQPRPGRAQRIAGMAFVTTAAMFAAVSAWAARPPELVAMDVVKVVARSPTPSMPPLRPEPASARPMVAAPSASRPTAPEVPVPAPAAAPVEGFQPVPAVPPEVVTVSLAQYPLTTIPIAASGARSAVEPGSAIQLVTMADAPDGKQLVSNMTTFGSQSQYRSGTYSTHGSRYGLRTQVTQRGDRAEVRIRMLEGENETKTLATGLAVLRSGETDQIVLSNGQSVSVSLLVRPETAYERRQGERVMARETARTTRRLALANARRCRTDPSAC